MSEISRPDGAKDGERSLPVSVETSISYQHGCALIVCLAYSRNVLMVPY